MIKKISGKRRVGLSQYQLSFTSHGKYHRIKIWAKNKDECEAYIAKAQGLINSPITWCEGFDIFFKAKFNVDATERYLQSVEAAINNMPFKDSYIADTTLEQLANHLQTRGKETSAQTSNKERAQILSVQNYLEHIERISSNPFKTVEKLKCNPAIREPILIENMGSYISALDLYTKPIIQFMALTGLRASEACNLKDDDISDSIFTAHCKGGKVRDISLESVREIISEARSIKRAKGIQSEYVFLNSHKSKWTAKALYVRVKYLWAQAGLSNKVTLHSLRHGFATALVIHANATIEQVAQQLGHSVSSKSMTSKYIHTTDESGTFKVRDEINSILAKQQALIAQKKFHIMPGA